MSSKQVQEYVLRQDHHLDVKLKGRVLGRHCTRTFSGPSQNRWVEYTGYKTAESIVIHIQTITQWEGERDTNTVEVFATRKDAQQWALDRGLDHDLKSFMTDIGCLGYEEIE